MCLAVTTHPVSFLLSMSCLFPPFDLKARYATSVNILLTPPSGGVPTGLWFLSHSPGFALV